MERTESERMVLRIPVELTAERLAALCRVKPDSPAWETVEECLPYVNEYGSPGAVIRWADVERVDGDTVRVNGQVFHSLVLADKLKESRRVFLSVITAGTGLERCPELEGDPFFDTLRGALLAHATGWVTAFMKERFGFDGRAMLNPGSLPDWPIANNFALFDLIGNAEEIGVSLNRDGYMRPWHTTSHIHFSGGNYQNCSLCRRYDCVGRRAKFDRAEYVRIFRIEP